MLSSERHSARSVLWLANDEQWRRLAVKAKVLFRWNALEEIATIETSGDAAALAAAGCSQVPSVSILVLSPIRSFRYHKIGGLANRRLGTIANHEGRDSELPIRRPQIHPLRANRQLASVDATERSCSGAKLTLGHEARTVMSRRHSDDSGGICHYGLRALGPGGPPGLPQTLTCAR